MAMYGKVAGAGRSDGSARHESADTLPAHEAGTGSRRTDCHAHAIALGRRLIEERHSEPSREATVAEYLKILDANGMGRGVLTAPSFYGNDNSVLLEALDIGGDRLRGTAIVAPDIDMSALKEMGRRNVVGIRLNWFRRSTLPDIRSSEYQSLLAKVRDLDWHIEIYLEGPKLAHVLPHVLASGVKVVLDHFASPDSSLGLHDPGFSSVLKGLSEGRIWVKLSGHFRLGDRDAGVYARELLRAGGPERLLFGSDWPWVGHEHDRTFQDCLARFESWIVDPVARKQILCNTPEELFHFPKTSIEEMHWNNK